LKHITAALSRLQELGPALGRPTADRIAGSRYTMKELRPRSFGDLVAGARHSAVHLELRDTYYSNPRLDAWLKGEHVDWSDRSVWWRPFHDQIAEAVARGVRVRRARVVSEPVTEYIRWEHYVTYANVAAGEEVRWLPRRRTADLLMPGCDFWIFDNKTIQIHDFAGNGDFPSHEHYDDPGLVRLNASAFEWVWERAIPHERYEIQ
jgi:hypothetical protein